MEQEISESSMIDFALLSDTFIDDDKKEYKGPDASKKSRVVF